MNSTTRVKLVRAMTVPISIRYILTGQLKFMSQQGFDVRAISADGPQVKEIVDLEQCRHWVVPFTRRVTPFTDLYCLLKLIILFLLWRPEIVHTQTPKAGLLGMIAAWITRVPVRIHTVGGMPLMASAGVRHFILLWSERITYLCAKKVYANSHGLEEYLLNRFGRFRKKIGVIGNASSNGIDTTFFSRSQPIVDRANAIRRQAGMAPGDLVFCFVGRLVGDKGIHELVDAFQMMKKASKRPAWLMLLGHFEDETDPVKKSTRALIETDERIVNPGFTNEVREHMAASDIFVFPSYREGFPNVVLQACAMELPSIVTRIIGSSEIIEDRKNGLLVDVKDTTGLFQAMQLLADDESLRKELAGNARARVVEKYEQHEIWKGIESEYIRLISEYVPTHY